MGIPSDREFIDDATVGKVPNGRTKEQGKRTPGIVSNIAVTYAATKFSAVCRIIVKLTIIASAIYRRREERTNMVAYTESAPKTDRHDLTLAELVNSISPRISSRP